MVSAPALAEKANGGITAIIYRIAIRSADPCSSRRQIELAVAHAGQEALPLVLVIDQDASLRIAGHPQQHPAAAAGPAGDRYLHHAGLVVLRPRGSPPAKAGEVNSGQVRTCQFRRPVVWHESSSRAARPRATGPQVPIF